MKCILELTVTQVERSLADLVSAVTDSGVKTDVPT